MDIHKTSITFAMGGNKNSVLGVVASPTLNESYILSDV